MIIINNRSSEEHFKSIFSKSLNGEKLKAAVITHETDDVFLQSFFSVFVH